MNIAIHELASIFPYMIKSTSINYKTVKNILSKMTPYCFSYINGKRMKGKEERKEGEKKEGKEGGSKS